MVSERRPTDIDPKPVDLLRAPDKDQLVKHFLPPHGARERPFLGSIRGHSVGPITNPRGRPRREIRVPRADAKNPLRLRAEDEKMSRTVANNYTRCEVPKDRRQDVGFSEAYRFALSLDRCFHIKSLYPVASP